MKIYIKILIGVLVAAVAVFLWFWLTAKPVEGITNRENYQFGDALDIIIKNNQDLPVCFSSCYPYLAEKQSNNDGWEQYQYGDCPMVNVATDCVAAKGMKKFRLSLSDVDAGLNRLKLPVCVNCGAGQEFKADLVLYSNTFEIK